MSVNSRSSGSGSLDGIQVQIAAQLASQMFAFHAKCATIWQRYENVGPGKVEADLLHGVQELFNSIVSVLENSRFVSLLSTNSESYRLATVEDVSGHMRRCVELVRRCVETREGLCFITGEAGLVPRKDQHAAFEDSLNRICQAARHLQGFASTGTNPESA